MRILPKALEISPRGISNKLKEAIYDFGVEESYRVAAHRLQVHYGFSLSPERIREKTLEKLQEIDKELAERKSITALPSQGAAAIIAQCDGAMVCTVTTGSGSDRRKKRTLEWKEARLCAATAQGSVTIFYEGLIGDVNETGKRWCHAAYRAGWAAETYLHPMGDGAPWIEDKPGTTFRAVVSCSICITCATTWPPLRTPAPIKKSRIAGSSGKKTSFVKGKPFK